MTVTCRSGFFRIAAALTALLGLCAPASGDGGCGPFSTIPAQCDYRDSWLLRWDPGNPTEMAAGASVQLSVQGGVPNYGWQVQGPGFILETDATGGRTNTLFTAPDSCGSTDITVTDAHGHQTGGLLTVPGPDLAWDGDYSVEVLPDDGTEVPVYVTGGRAPYVWMVSDGFRLGCEQDCGSSNTVASLGADCVGTITVIDACESEVTGFIRRPGRWGTETCYRYKGTLCYPSQGCGASGQFVVANHKIRLSCCTNGATVKTGICSVDGWEFTAEPALCPEAGSRCPTNAKVWSLYIYPWVCD
jgi:hypothetical protein